MQYYYDFEPCIRIDYDDADWEPITGHQGSLVTFFRSSPKHKPLIPCISVFRHERVFASISNILKNTQEELAGYLKEYKNKVIDMTDTQVIFEYSGIHNRTPLKFYQAIYKVDSTVYSVTFGCNEGSYQDEKDAFEKIKIIINTDV